MERFPVLKFRPANASIDEYKVGDSLGRDHRARVADPDCFKGLKSLVTQPTKRALVLIDPLLAETPGVEGRGAFRVTDSGNL